MFEDVRRHVFADHQAHHAAKAPLPHAFFDGFEQILRFQFFDRDVRVAGDVERMRFEHLHSGKQRTEMSRDHLLQPHELQIAIANAGASV